MKNKLNLLLGVAVIALPLISCGENSCVHKYYDGVCAECNETDPKYVPAENRNPEEKETTNDEGHKIIKSSTSTEYTYAGITKKTSIENESDETDKISNTTTALISGGKLSCVSNSNAKTDTTVITNADGGQVITLTETELEDGSTELRNQNGDSIVYTYDRNGNITSQIRKAMK